MSSRVASLIGITLGLLLSVNAVASAQTPAPAAPAPATIEFPSFELTGGYQWLHTPDTDFPIGLNLDGAWNLSKMFALVGEGGWVYKSEDDEDGVEDAKLNAFNIGVGPRITARGGARFWPYGQILVGALHARSSATFAGTDIDTSETRLMIQPGVGVNVVAGDGWGVVGAVDYRRVILDEEEDGDSGENEFRVFIGIRLMLD